MLTKHISTLIEKDYLGDLSPEKDCCWWLMFRQPVQKPSSESRRWLPHRLSKRQSPTTVLLRTPITQMIFFNQGMLLVGSKHFLKACIYYTSVSYTINNIYKKLPRPLILQLCSRFILITSCTIYPLYNLDRTLRALWWIIKYID